MDNEISTSVEETEKNYNGISTLNHYGWMLQIDDPHFAESIQLVDKNKLVGDFGVAFGYSAKKLLNEGFNVIANDLDEKMLNFLWNNVSIECQSRLKLVPGDIKYQQFDKNTFGAIYAFRWMHFLKGHEFRQTMEKFYDWLAPGGILVVSCINNVCPEGFLSSKSHNTPEWPGEASWIMNKTIKENMTPEFIHFISLNVLVREALKAGFDIYKGNLDNF